MLIDAVRSVAFLPLFDPQRGTTDRGQYRQAAGAIAED